MTAHTIATAIGQAVAAAREARGWSRLQLARRTGVPERTIRRLEQGETLRASTVDEVCSALGVLPHVEFRCET